MPGPPPQLRSHPTAELPQGQPRPPLTPRVARLCPLPTPADAERALSQTVRALTSTSHPASGETQTGVEPGEPDRPLSLPGGPSSACLAGAFAGRLPGWCGEALGLQTELSSFRGAERHGVRGSRGVRGALVNIRRYRKSNVPLTDAMQRLRPQTHPPPPPPPPQSRESKRQSLRLPRVRFVSALIRSTLILLILYSRD